LRSAPVHDEIATFPVAQAESGRTSGLQPVERPEPGLARGRWEAPAWIFWTIALITAALALTWAVVALRMSLERRGRRPRTR